METATVINLIAIVIMDEKEEREEKIIFYNVSMCYGSMLHFCVYISGS